MGDNVGKTNEALNKAMAEPMLLHAESISALKGAESFGQLVGLGFDVTVFAPAPYQRRSLQRPS